MADNETPRSNDNDYSNEQMNEVLQQMNELFSRYKDESDLDTIHINRLLEVLQAFGRNPSQSDCDKRIHELEDDEKFELTFKDFLQILEESWTLINNDRNILRKAFAKFDLSNEGSIDIEQFRTIMRTLGEPLSDDEIDELVQLGLNDKHKKIDIEYLLDQLLGNEE
ncbi:unnamed protein product [Adineta steineri]|uniref:EF-hand domain-containing protein n=1 Tax=Adineta steineri TaxID=433720 RepID=A0A815AV07_9BILA|nr:unnamed protein product [Adineta steineri]CAF3635399.1 unnamed protein product [Adineta steineri]